MGNPRFAMTGPAEPSDAWASGMIAVLCTAIAWLRLSPEARDTLWAEDGRVFLHGAASASSQWQTLLHPYAGYLHLVPRIEAIATVDLVPVPGWAVSMTALSCAAAGIVAAVVFVASREFVPWMPARIALAALTVVTPLASREVLGDATNLHSLLLWGLFWALLCRPRSALETGLLTAYALAASLTEIQVLFLLPLLAWNRHERRSSPVKAALILGAAAQLVATLASPRGHTGNPPVGLPSIVDGWLINAVATSWVSIPRLGSILVTAGPAIWLLALIPASALAITTVLGSRRQRVAGWLLFAGSVVVWSAGVVVNPASWYEYARLSASQLQHVWLSRYGVVPAMMLLAQLCLAASVIHRRERSRPRAALGAAMVILVVIVGALQATAPLSRRDAGPQWQSQLFATAEACDLPDARTASFAETLSWKVVVPCRYVDADGMPPPDFLRRSRAE